MAWKKHVTLQVSNVSICVPEQILVAAISDSHDKVINAISSYVSEHSSEIFWLDMKINSEMKVPSGYNMNKLRVVSQILTPRMKRAVVLPWPNQT